MQAVGYVYDRFADEADDLAKTIRLISDHDLERVSLTGLAGTNDIVQWIADIDTWRGVALVALGWLSEKVADDLYGYLKDRLLKNPKNDQSQADQSNSDELIADLAEIAARVQAKGGSFQLRVELNLPTNSDDPRGSFVDLPPVAADSKISVARQLVQMGLSADKLDQSNQALRDTVVKPGFAALPGEQQYLIIDGPRADDNPVS